MKTLETQSKTTSPFGEEDPKIAYNRVWFNILRAHRKFHPVIAKALRKEGIKDPIWYEILLAVESAGAKGQPMQQLEENLFVPQYALSRHISRLDQGGLLRREFVSDGKRKQILFLTSKGAGVHERIWPVYMEAMQEAIAPLISTEHAYELAFHLIKLLPRNP